MSYTPTSWSTGDTITAAAMNKIENGIANAGGGVDCILYMDSNGAVAAYGDFASALAKLASGVPISILNYAVAHTSTIFSGGVYPTVMGWMYDTADPNQITIYDSSTSGYIWDANGLTWWD